MGASIPTHIGLILDGNRRWAQAHGLPQLEGHRRGFENLKTIGQAAVDRGVKYLSAFIFSTENWKRSQQEVKYLMDLALDVAKNQMTDVITNGIRLRFLGSEENIRSDILDTIDEAEKKSAGNTRGTLAICFNYGGQLEIIDAIHRASAAGEDLTTISPQSFEKYLYAPDIPPLDVIIRTSGEQRLSNFMLWRAAYSELYFVNKHWPDFTVADLDNAITAYQQRHRRFGGG